MPFWTEDCRNIAAILAWKGEDTVSKFREKRGAYFRFKPEVDALIESHKDKNEDNRTEFVEDAIRYYCCHLDSESNRGVLSSEVIQAIEGVVTNQFNRLSYMLFKLAEEMSVNNYLHASENPKLSEADYNNLRIYVRDKIRKTHGWIKLEDAIHDEAID